MFRLPRRQMLSTTNLSLSDLHSKICARLEETDPNMHGEYLLEYAIFMRKHVHLSQSDSERATLRDLYITTVASSFSDIVPEVAEAVAVHESVSSQHNSTQACDCGGYMLFVQGHDVCESCGFTEARTDDSIAAVPFGTTVESSRYPYRRQHHFREWLCQVQGRESTRINNDDMAAIKEQIRKERLNVRLLDNKRLRAILKTLRLQKLYEHVPYLLHILEGSTPPQLTHELETLFMNMFAQIQTPFERHVKTVCPHRKNFLSYSFVLAKFCQLAGGKAVELIPFFSQLKSREKLIVQDKVWKLICEDPDVGWPFHASI